MLTKRRLVVQFIILIVICGFALGYASDNYPTTQISSSECYDAYGKPRVRVLITYFLISISLLIIGLIQ